MKKIRDIARSQCGVDFFLEATDEMLAAEFPVFRKLVMAVVVLLVAAVESLWFFWPQFFLSNVKKDD